MAIKVKYDFKKLAAHFVETCVIALVWLTFAVIKPEPSLSIINIAHNAHIVILVFFMLFLVSSLIEELLKYQGVRLLMSEAGRLMKIFLNDSPLGWAICTAESCLVRAGAPLATAAERKQAAGAVSCP